MDVMKVSELLNELERVSQLIGWYENQMADGCGSGIGKVYLEKHYVQREDVRSQLWEAIKCE